MKNPFYLFIFAVHLFGQNVTAVKFTDLQTEFLKLNDTLYVINFWATWCGPCLEELPYFNSLTERTRNQKIRIFTVSLDFKSKLKNVNDYLKRRPLLTTTILLDETDADSYINKIDPRWSGAIPATVLFKKGKVVGFKEEKFDNSEQLEEFVSPFLTHN